MKRFRIGSHRLCSWNRDCVCSKHHKCQKKEYTGVESFCLAKKCSLERSHWIIRQQAYSSGELFVRKTLSFATFVAIIAAGYEQNCFCIQEWLTSIWKFMYLYIYWPNLLQQGLEKLFLRGEVFDCKVNSFDSGTEIVVFEVNQERQKWWVISSSKFKQVSNFWLDFLDQILNQLLLVEELPFRSTSVLWLELQSSESKYEEIAVFPEVTLWLSFLSVNIGLTDSIRTSIGKTSTRVPSMTKLLEISFFCWN